jgi:hypothetical protein
MILSVTAVHKSLGAAIQVLRYVFFVFLGLPSVVVLGSLSLFLVLYLQSLMVVFGISDFNVTSGALIPRRSTAHREGQQISFFGHLLLRLLLAVYDFFVYISLRDNGLKPE